MKKLYSKKYGIFVWYKEYEEEPARLVALGVSGINTSSVRVHGKENLNYRLKYYKGRAKKTGEKFVGEPFIVRITGKKVRMKTGILILDWAHSNKSYEEYVPYKFIPDFDGNSSKD